MPTQVADFAGMPLEAVGGPIGGLVGAGLKWGQKTFPQGIGGALKGLLGRAQPAVKGLTEAAPTAAKEAPYSAEFGHHWPELGEPQYKVLGGPKGGFEGSHVGAARLKELGVPIPYTPPPTTPYPSRIPQLTGGPAAPGSVRSTLGRGQIMPSEEGVDSILGLMKQNLASVPKQGGRGSNVNQAANLSVQDILKPQSAQTASEMFQETNPVFKQMEQSGMFRRGQ